MSGNRNEGGRRGKVMLEPPPLPPTLAIPREVFPAPKMFPEEVFPLPSLINLSTGLSSPVNSTLFPMRLGSYDDREKVHPIHHFNCNTQDSAWHSVNMGGQRRKEKKKKVQWRERIYQSIRQSHFFLAFVFIVSLVEQKAVTFSIFQVNTGFQLLDNTEPSIAP